MVNSGIKQDGLSKIKVDPCGVHSLRVKANSVLCAQCGKWIHGRSAALKRVTPKSLMNSTCRKCEWNIGEAVDQEEKLCDEVETVKRLASGFIIIFIIYAFPTKPYMSHFFTIARITFSFHHGILATFLLISAYHKIH